MVGFNLAVLATVERLGATNAGVVIGASPIVLALLVPLLARRTPSAPFVAAALWSRWARRSSTAPTTGSR
jgi:hypothetical protein